MEPKLLSVIVAVYNVEPYLRECIDSLLNQTYKNLEIILINDGSTDSSGQICDEYKNQDNRVHVIHQQNGGISRARNAGLNAMKGDYITIVDSDDYLLPEAFENSIHNLETYNLDYIIFGSFRSGSGGNGSGKVTLSLEDKHQQRLINCLTYEGAIGWGVIYKKKCWENIRYPESQIYEDSVVAHYIIDKSQRCGYIDKEYYFYRKNPTGICNTAIFKPRTRFDYILACENRLTFAIQKNLCIPEARTALIKAILSYLTSFYGTNTNKDALFLKAHSLLLEQRKLPYNKSLLNTKYRIYLWCFNRFDFIQKIGSKISLTAQKLKYK